MNLYTTYSDFLKKHFDGKVQKLPVDVANTCPVRDGTIARGGCDFCNARSFVPKCCQNGRDVLEQLERGKAFFMRKYSAGCDVSYLAYFQSGTNTYGPLARGRELIEAALESDDVKGVVIATRPDCLTDDWLDYLQRLSAQTFVMVELGIESVDDQVLERVHRGHTFGTSRKAVNALQQRGVPVCAHLIFGLPGERHDYHVKTAETVNALHVDVVKLHQLQVLKGSQMAHDYQAAPTQFRLYDLNGYVCHVADFLEHLSPLVAVERFVSQSPAGQLIAPKWGVKNDVVTQHIMAELRRRGSWQGKFERKV